MPTEAHRKYPPVYTMFLARVAREFCAGNLLSVDMDGSFQSMLPCRWVNPAAHLELARRERVLVPSDTHTPSCVVSMYTHAPVVWPTQSLISTSGVVLTTHNDSAYHPGSFPAVDVGCEVVGVAIVFHCLQERLQLTVSIYHGCYSNVRRM